VSGAVISSVSPNSPAALAGLNVGDTITSINGVPPTDVIEYQRLTDGDEVTLLVQRGDEVLLRQISVSKEAGQPLGITVESAVFDRIRTCDNHCSFCFIYQLPKGMRRSLYIKDDDYRLSFLYGNYTTMTRFTEFDLERVVDEGLSPLYVSIHTTNPELRADMLRNPRGATSLRWLGALLDLGIAVHGQVVLCPEVNDGHHLEQTLSDVLTKYSALRTLSVVPVGVSVFSTEETMRPMGSDEALRTIQTVERWASVALSVVGRPLFYASDELYLLAGLPTPAVNDEDIVDLIENGVGLSATFTDSFRNSTPMNSLGTGFFQSVDGAPAIGYRAPRLQGETLTDGTAQENLCILTGEYGAEVLRSLITDANIKICAVRNDYFGGNIKVAGLMTGSDLSRTMIENGLEGVRFVLPDVCLSEGRFLDGLTPAELPAFVDIVPTSGVALREYLDTWRSDRSKRP
jgi:putative radical SAM enzyme (TIGR03279 family)